MAPTSQSEDEMNQRTLLYQTNRSLQLDIPIDTTTDNRTTARLIKLAFYVMGHLFTGAATGSGVLPSADHLFIEVSVVSISYPKILRHSACKEADTRAALYSSKFVFVWKLGMIAKVTVASQRCVTGSRQPGHRDGPTVLA